MNYHINTGLIIEKFGVNCSCPLCEIQKVVEKQFINEFLNDAVMEENTRLTVNAKGFCAEHFDKLFAGQNKLSLAIQVSSRVTAAKWLLDKPKSVSAAKKCADKIDSASNSCVICELVEESMVKYYKTIAQMYRFERDFYKMILETDGFCLKHYAELLRYARFAGSLSKDYLELLSTVEKGVVNRVNENLQAFCFAHDHRNARMPLGNAENALPVIREKLYGKK